MYSDSNTIKPEINNKNLSKHTKAFGNLKQVSTKKLLKRKI